MHDHVQGVILGIPQKQMDKFPTQIIGHWIFVEEDGRIHEGWAPNIYGNVIPEWDEFDQKWYWVSVPNE